ncbi:MAG: putative glycoside hydrolase [Chloroflexota bacterium]|nr:carboxypeptidase regulatory-like domain-containing protein [Chloroflexota bacterium]
MARRRSRGLSYLPPIPRRTPLIIYIFLAVALLVALYQVKQGMVKSVAGEVVDIYTGQPIAEANITLKNETQLAHTAGIATEFTTKSDSEGRFLFPQALEKYSLRVEATNYRPSSEESYNQTYTAQFRLKPFILKGLVRDNLGNPISHASVTMGNRTVSSGVEGDFQLLDPPESGNLIVKAAGFSRNTVSFEKTMRQDVELKPFRAKGVYLPATSAADKEFLPTILNLIDSTDLNTVVVDMKDESGLVFFDSKQSLAKTAPDNRGRIGDLPGFVKLLHSHEVYLIARLVVFIDPVLTDEKPEWALKSRSTGKLWSDAANYNWSNPYSQEVWEYNISLAKELAVVGFDEIQFDYVRFPALGNLADIEYGRTSDAATRTEAVSGFLKRARDVLTPYGTYTSINIFGLSTLQNDELGMGTKLETLADQVDYISPTLYPSSWSKGTFGFDQPATRPYDMILNTLLNAKPFIQGRSSLLRPWLQDFSIGGVTYGSKEVRDQIRAADMADSGAVGGWMLWNSQSRYTAQALGPKPIGEVRNNAAIPKP